MKNITIQSYVDALATRKITAKESIQSYLDTIKKINPSINAFITIDKEGALAQAASLDEKIAAGESVGKLAGVPIAVKDNIVTTTMPTTCASKMLENYVSPFNATVIDKLLEEDAIIIGKTNLDEFAMGATTESSFFGATKNPLNAERVPGGSSGGSAAAVAADMCVCAIGSDTGGSIRQPAAYCGIYGLKPTYGSVSRHGLVAFASSLDQIGPLADNIPDLAVMMDVMSGHDNNDATSVNQDYPQYGSELDKGVAGLRVGLPVEFLKDAVDTSVRNAVQKAADTLKEMGATVEECHLLNLDAVIPAYYLIATAEASSNLARFDGVRFGLRVERDDTISMFKATRAEGFGAEVKRRIMLGTYALSAGYYDAYYLKALKVRRLIKDTFHEFFEKYDVLLAPTAIQVAPKLHQDLDAVQVYQQDICTCPANLAGLPALSMPFGQDQDMPIGLQIIGNYWQEPMVLRVGQALDAFTKEEK